MDVVDVPYELVRWTVRRSEQSAARLTDLEQEYVTATDEGNLKCTSRSANRHGHGRS